MPEPSKAGFEIARNYRNVAAKIDDYLIEKFEGLTASQRAQLASLSSTLYQAGNAAAFAAAQLDLSQMQEATDHVKAVTARMAAAIDSVDDVSKVIAATSSAIALVGALATANLSGILGAANDLAGKVDAIAG